MNNGKEFTQDENNAIHHPEYYGNNIWEERDKILENHSSLAKSINKLRTSTRLCISSVSSDMHGAKSELDWLNNSGNISTDEFVTMNSVSKDIGKEFNNCRCLSRE